MNPRIFRPLLALAALCAATAALPAAAGDFGFGLLGQARAQRDLQASPLLYQGPGVGLWIQGRESAGAWCFGQDLRFLHGGVQLAGSGRRSFSLRTEDPVTGEDAVTTFREPSPPRSPQPSPSGRS